jgi:hypothetical protein
MGDMIVSSKAAKARLMFAKVRGFLTAERLSALLVSGVGSLVGAYAADGWRHGTPWGLTPLQWSGAAMAVIGSILVAVLVRVWPAKAPADSRNSDII